MWAGHTMSSNLAERLTFAVADLNIGVQCVDSPFLSGIVQKRRGFTIIDVLVGLGIISIILGLVLPLVEQITGGCQARSMCKQS